MPGFNDFLASQAPGQMVGGQVAPQAGLLDRVFAGLLGTPSNYGGLLSPEAVRDAQRQQRIALGAQLLQAGGPQQHPVSFGQALGSAVQAGNQAGYVAQDQQLKTALAQQELDQRRQQIMQRAQSPFGNISPSDYTPQSLAKFQQSGNYGDLEPKGGGNNIGNYNPGDFTTASWAKFIKTSDPADLVRYVTPANPSVVVNPGLGVAAVTPNRVNPSAPPAVATVLGPEQMRAAEGATATTKSAGEAAGKARGENIAALPDTLADIDKFSSEIDGLIGSPGFSQIYGLQRVTDPRNLVPGSDASNAEARRGQLDAASFGIAIQKMRGLGQLSNAEGNKVSAAFTRATNTKQSPEAALEAWYEVKTILGKAAIRANNKAGVDQRLESTQQILNGIGKPSAPKTFKTSGGATVEIME